MSSSATPSSFLSLQSRIIKGDVGAVSDLFARCKDQSTWSTWWSTLLSSLADNPKETSCSRSEKTALLKALITHATPSPSHILPIVTALKIGWLDHAVQALSVWDTAGAVHPSTTLTRALLTGPSDKVRLKSVQLFLDHGDGVLPRDVWSKVVKKLVKTGASAQGIVDLLASRFDHAHQSPDMWSEVHADLACALIEKDQLSTPSAPGALRVCWAAANPIDKMAMLVSAAAYGAPDQLNTWCQGVVAEQASNPTLWAGVDMDRCVEQLSDSAIHNKPENLAVILAHWPAVSGDVLSATLDVYNSTSFISPDNQLLLDNMILSASPTARSEAAVNLLHAHEWSALDMLLSRLPVDEAVLWGGHSQVQRALQKHVSQAGVAAFMPHLTALLQSDELTAQVSSFREAPSVRPAPKM